MDIRDLRSSFWNSKTREENSVFYKIIRKIHRTDNESQIIEKFIEEFRQFCRINTN